MNKAAIATDRYAEDRAITLRNRARLNANGNLLYWYHELYQHQFQDCSDPRSLKILEIGSGVSPLQRFQPNVLTSDVLKLDYVDYIFDCHSIDQFEAIENESLDVITMTNVLHHLKDPISFLSKSAKKLRRGGRIMATEPYFSALSTLIFKYVHHEPVDFGILEPILPNVWGPLTSANIALPWLIFVKNPRWCERLRANFQFDTESFRPFSSISYMATGGISHRIPIPSAIYRRFFVLDLALSQLFPQLLASFFTIILTRK